MSLSHLDPEPFAVRYQVGTNPELRAEGIRIWRTSTARFRSMEEANRIYVRGMPASRTPIVILAAGQPGGRFSQSVGFEYTLEGRKQFEELHAEWGYFVYG